VAETIRLAAGGAEAEIAPAFGANCLSARVAGRDLIEPPPSLDALAAAPNGYGCPILFPFPGQLEPGVLRLLGRDVRIDPNSPSGRHGHGFASRRPWRVLDRAADSATCQLEGRGDEFYPWWFRLTARWRVSAAGVAVGVSVENLDDGPMPFGFGLHPYLPAGANALVEVPTEAEWPHEGGIPSGPSKAGRGPWAWSELPEGGSLLLTDMPGDDVEARAGDVAVRWPGQRFGEVVLYRPPGRASVCVEPWTSVSNAAAQLEPGTAGGLVVLPPTATWRAWLEVGLAG
jgi:aldose 1-epimerase